MKLYIIPAYEETAKNQGYRQIISSAKKKKYEIEILNLQIKGASLSKLVDQGVKTITDKNCVLFGFSAGALIAYCISKKIAIRKGIFCSISPILGKDALENYKLHQKYFGKKTTEELVKTKYGKSIAKNKVFLCGDGEGAKMISRTKKIQKANGGKLIIVKNNDHELNSVYIRAIVKEL